MARVQLSNKTSLRGARRELTRRGSEFTLTLRHGNVYTYHKVRARQPNTAAQLNARKLLAQANVLAREDVLLRHEYWAQRASATGYKTAIGCARAYFVALLKARASRPSSLKANAVRRAQSAFRKCLAVTPVRSSGLVSSLWSPVVRQRAIRQHIEPVFI